MRVVQQRRNEKNSQQYDNDSLPSYNIATGLPTYDEAIERMKPVTTVTTAATVNPKSASSKPPTISVVYVKDEVAKPGPKFGLVSHSLFTHNGGCSHCLSVQELLETYNVR